MPELRFKKPFRFSCTIANVGGRFELGVCFGLYCLDHGESLDVDKFGFIQKRNKPGIPETVERIRAMLEEAFPDRGPNELWLDERRLTLISAFSRRHQDCELKVWNDAQSSFWNLLERMYRDPDWLEFNTWDDGPSRDHQEQAHIERFERHIRNLRSKLKSLENDLANGRIKKFRMKRTLKRIEDLRKSIPKQIESQDQLMKRIYEREVDREGFVDLLEEIQSKPILPYPRPKPANGVL